MGLRLAASSLQQKQNQRMKGCRQNGFSMIELMLTVVFVLLGSQMIQGGFLRGAEIYGRYSNSLDVMIWVNERSAEFQEQLLKEEISQGQESGIFQFSGKEFSWSRSVDMMPGPNLFSIKHLVSWKESGKPLQIERQMYVYQPDGSQKI